MKKHSLDALIREVKTEAINFEARALGFETRLRARLSRRTSIQKITLWTSAVAAAVCLGIFLWPHLSQNNEDQFYSEFEDVLLAGLYDELEELTIDDWLWNGDF